MKAANGTSSRTLEFNFPGTPQHSRRHWNEAHFLYIVLTYSSGGWTFLVAFIRTG